MAAVGVIELYEGRVRPWMYRWGATDEEVALQLPGDELMEATTPRTTRAITIDAAVDEVWPWLAQLGEDRGGFYSYSWLERVAGANIRNANAVHRQWQDVRRGDSVWLARRYGGVARLVVAAVKPNSYLLLMSPDDFDRVQHGAKAIGAWGFYLHENRGWTRLLVRGCGGAVGHAAFDLPHFVMEQKMMRGIRHRAELLRRDHVNAFARYQHRGRRESVELVK